MTTPPAQPESADATAPAPPKKRRFSRWKVFLVAAVVSPLLVFGLYTWIALSWSYSEGDRSGILQKFSHKGWFCKTWEGELAMSIVPGVTPTIWQFSVRGDSAAHRVNVALGRRVVLHYREHRGVPTSCFGQTPYFVDSVRVLEGQ